MTIKIIDPFIVFQPDDQSPGGRKMLGKVKIPPGEYVLEVRINFGPLIIQIVETYPFDKANTHIIKISQRLFDSKSSKV